MAGIPDSQGKNAHKLFDKPFAKLEVKAGDDGDVDALPDGSSTPGKPRPQVMMVINFAVADHGYAGFWIRNRLLAIMQAADRQPRCPQYR